jgi:hypothetical protein
MWTKFSNKYYPTLTLDEYDYIYFECNEPCAKMFIERIIDKSNYYKLSYYSDYPEPTITNCMEYVGNWDSTNEIYFRIRVITMQELIGLGLVAPNENGDLINNLILYQEITSYLENPTSR